MRTAVDSSVLIDVLGQDPVFWERSRDALAVAYDTGALIACEIVWAEVRAYFVVQEDFTDAMRGIGLGFEPLSAQAAMVAGQLWQEYRRQARGVRTRIVSDYLIGAHALVHADSLLTRDRGFYRSYFRGLTLIDPTQE